MRVFITLFLLAAFAFGPLPPAAGQSTYWVTSSGNWQVPFAWSNGLPNSSSIAFISNGGTATLDVNAGIIEELRIGYNGNGGLVLNTGANLTVNYHTVIGRGQTSGSLQINGGSFNASAGAFSLGMVLGIADGSGTVTVSAGQCVSKNINIGFEGSGLFVVSGTGLVTSLYAELGSTASGTGTLRLNGGLFTTGQISKGNGSATVSFDGGTLRLSGNQNALFSNIGSVTLNAGGGTIDTQAFTVATATSFTGNGSLTKTGTGTLTLSGGNTYTGGTTVTSGTLALNRDEFNNGSPAIAGNAGTITVASGATLRFDASNALGGNTATAAPAVYAYGGISNSGNFYNLLQNLTLDNGTLSAVGGYGAGYGSYGVRDTLTSSGTSTITLSGPNAALNLGPSGTTTFNVTDGILRVNASISDNPGVGAGTVSGTLIKNGAGTMVLNGANTYTGGTAVNGGILALNRDAALSSPAIAANSGTISVASGATLRFDSNNALGTTSATTGPDLSVRGTVTNSGNYYNLLQNVTFYQGGVLSASGGFAGYGSFAIRNKVATLLNFVTATITISGPNAALALSPAGTTTFQTSGNGQLNVNAPIIDHNGGVPGMLLKTGTGTLTLTGAGTYTGGTTVDGGTLALNHDAPAFGGTPAIAFGIVTVNSGATLRFDSNNNFGDINVTATPAVVVNNGTITNTGGYYNQIQHLTLNGSTLTGVGGYGFGYGSYAVRDTLTSTGNSSIALGTANNGALGLSSDGTTTFNVQSGTLTVNATVTNSPYSAGALLKTGAGTMVLTQANTYSGGTSITGGTLAIASDAALGAAGVTITGASLRTDAAMVIARPLTISPNTVAFLDTNGNNVTISSVVSGNGGFIKQGAGTLTLTNINNSQGNNRIDGGSLSISDDRHLGTAGGTLFMNGGTLEVPFGDITFNRPMVMQNSSTVSTGGTSFQWSGPITGGGMITKNNLPNSSGNLRLNSANNTWTGGLNIVAGGVLIGNFGSPGSLGTGPVILGDYGALGFYQSNAITVNQVISGTGYVTVGGPATTTFTAANTFSGRMEVSGGLLVIATPSTPGVSGTGSAPVHVYGGTLGGTGRIGGQLTVKQTGIVRGDSGTGTGTLLLDGGAVFQAINSDKPTLAVQLATSAGTISASSLVSLTAGKCNLNFVGGGGRFWVQVLNDADLALGQTYTIPLAVGPTGGQTFQHNGSDLANGYNFNAADFQVVGDGAWNYSNANLFIQNNSLMLSFTTVPVPEPALLGVALLAVAAWRRRPRS